MYKNVCTKVLYLLPLVCITACNVGPTYKDPKLDIPEITKNDEYIPIDWWRVFDDDTLNSLQMLALKNNYDIKIAIANIDEVIAMSSVSDYNFLPSADAFVKYSDSINSENTQMGNMFNNAGGMRYPTTTQDRMLGISASYELDFWGKYRSNRDATIASLKISIIDKYLLQLTVTSTVAKTYFKLLAANAQLLICKKMLHNQITASDITKSMFCNGYCNEIHMNNANLSVSELSNKVSTIKEQIVKLENVLKMLVGLSPRELFAFDVNITNSISKLKVRVKIPVNISSQLLQRRPDIAKAKQTLVAANAKIGEVKSGYFPSLTLTNSIGFQSAEFSDIFSTKSGIVNFGAQITMPLFNLLKIQGLTKAAEAKYTQALHSYEKIVVSAFKEVYDSIVHFKFSKKILHMKEFQYDIRKRNYEIAIKQKEAGLISKLDLISAENAYLTTSMDCVDSVTEHVDAIVDLCKSIGGGYSFK